MSLDQPILTTFGGSSAAVRVLSQLESGDTVFIFDSGQTLFEVCFGQRPTVESGNLQTYSDFIMFGRETLLLQRILLNSSSTYSLMIMINKFSFYIYWKRDIVLSFPAALSLFMAAFVSANTLIRWQCKLFTFIILSRVRESRWIRASSVLLSLLCSQYWILRS